MTPSGPLRDRSSERWDFPFWRLFRQTAHLGYLGECRTWWPKTLCWRSWFFPAFCWGLLWWQSKCVRFQYEGPLEDCFWRFARSWKEERIIVFLEGSKASWTRRCLTQPFLSLFQSSSIRCRLISTHGKIRSFFLLLSHLNSNLLMECHHIMVCTS